MIRKVIAVLVLLVLFTVIIPIASAVTVNEYPVAAAKVSLTGFYACECESVELDGSGSSDKDGWITEWDWYSNGKLIGQGEQITLGKKFTENCGIYIVTLRVTDNGGATDETEITFHVWNNPRPQIDEIDWEREEDYYDDDDRDFLVIGDNFTVDVDLIDEDTDHGKIIYEWDYPTEVFRKIGTWQSSDGEEEETTFEVISNGIGGKTSYEIGVTVSNACGKGGVRKYIELEVKSSQCNSPPEAEITFLSSVIDEEESFQVSSAGSTTGQDRNEGDDEIVFWRWNVTDERGEVIETSSQEDPYFTIEDSGIYIISLKVTDRFGATGETREPFRVGDVENNHPPTADCSSTKETATYGKSFELNGSGSNDNRDWDGRGDPDDLISWYIWRDETYGEELCRSKNPICNIIFNRTGPHEIVLEVRDTGDRIIDEDDDEINVLSGTDSIIINVTASSEPAPTETSVSAPASKPILTPSPTATPALIPPPALEKIPAPTKSFLGNFRETIENIIGALLNF